MLIHHLYMYNTIMKYYSFLNELFEKWKVDKDCQQMIWQSLLEYDQNKLEELDSKGELKYWLVRFVKNNWFSKNSKYYYTYLKYYEIFKEPLEQQNDELED